ncbi:MAG: hypothetical protein ACREML_08920 [Vulcanimicrobiaceae bacterium]
MTGKAITRNPGALQRSRAYGTCMSALKPRQQDFVEALFQVPPGSGALVAAVRLSQCSDATTDQGLREAGHRYLASPKVVSAIEELTRQRLRALGPAAVTVVQDIMADAKHKDRLAAAKMLIERIDPATSKLEVTHEVVNHDADAVAHLRHLKELGVGREKLEEVFGFSGLGRYEKLLADEDRAAGKIIDADYVEVSEDEDASAQADTWYGEPAPEAGKGDK